MTQRPSIIINQQSRGLGVATLESFGATGNGIDDDSAALSAAIAYGQVIGTYGRTYRIGSAIEPTFSFAEFRGNQSTLLMDSSGTDATPVILNGSTQLNDFRFSASDQRDDIVRFIQLSGEAASHHVDRCTFDGLYSDTSAAGLAFKDRNMGEVKVTNSTFKNITALSDDSAGNSNGVANGIFTSAGADKMIVNDCTFENINSVITGRGGDLVAEDANGIQSFNSSSKTVKLFKSNRCNFTNVGKRGFKIHNSLSASIKDSDATSSWDGVSNDYGMQGLLSVYAGKLYVENSHLKGGLAQGFTVMDTNTDELEFKNCSFLPDQFSSSVEAEAGSGSLPTAALLYATNVTIDGFHSYNVNKGISTSTSSVTEKAYFNDVNLRTYLNGLLMFGAIEKLNITDSRLYLDDLATGTGLQAVQIGRDCTSSTCTGNTISRYRDAFWLQNRLAANNGDGDCYFGLIGNDAYGVTNEVIRPSSDATYDRVDAVNLFELGNSWN